jgi:hypothetical protein
MKGAYSKLPSSSLILIQIILPSCASSPPYFIPTFGPMAKFVFLFYMLLEKTR